MPKGKHGDGKVKKPGPVKYNKNDPKTWPEQELQEAAGSSNPSVRKKAQAESRRRGFVAARRQEGRGRHRRQKRQ